MFLSSSLLSQYQGTISSDRPGQAITPFTTGKSYLQNQTGVEIGAMSTDTESSEHFSAESAFRFGLTESFEVAALLRYRNEENEFSDTAIQLNGIDHFALQLRSNIMVGEGLKPTLGFQVSIGMPWLSEDYDMSNAYPKITFISSQSLNSNISLTTNIGTEWMEDSPDPRGFYVINLAASFTASFGVFVEHYADIQGGDWLPRFDGGVYYLMSNDYQFDFSGGYFTNSEIESEYFISMGFSWRINMSSEENN